MFKRFIHFLFVNLGFLFCLLIFCVANTIKPLISIPEKYVDDLDAYKDYSTLFFKDCNENVVQIYYDALSGRVVNLLANSMNESVGFTLKTQKKLNLPEGKLYPKITQAKSYKHGNYTVFEYILVLNTNRIEVGHFLLSSMRFERDFQYSKLHLQPFKSIRYSFIPQEFHEFMKLVKEKNLNIYNEIYNTLFIDVKKINNGVLLSQTSITKNNEIKLSMIIENGSLKVDTDKVVFYSSKQPILIRVIIETNAKPLTPKKRIFNDSFWKFYEDHKNNLKSLRDKKLFERQVKGAELLVTKEKLFAGLPNFATYFGRDSLMFAIIMNEIIDPYLLQDIIEMVILKLNDRGEVSHEESLGFQAIRENIQKYLNSEEIKKPLDYNLINSLDKTVENYVMIDDDFQLPVVFRLYLENRFISDKEKIEFLKREKNNESYLELILRNFSFVFDKALPYYLSGNPDDLVKFPFINGSYVSASWRDSGFGYCGGSYPMDVNVIWVPYSLKSINYALKKFSELNINYEYHWFKETNLYKYYKEGKVDDVIKVWEKTGKYFAVSLNHDEIKEKFNLKESYLGLMEQNFIIPLSLKFLGISRDDHGNVIPLMNTDLGIKFVCFALIGKDSDFSEYFKEALDFYSLTVLPYPLGLFIDNVGVVCCNDTYTNVEIWKEFEKDTYHSPKAVWGREVNIILLGLLDLIEILSEEEDNAKHFKQIIPLYKNYFYTIYNAVEKSGLKNSELWSYEFENNNAKAIRYHTSSDIQLWNLSSLAVEYKIYKLKKKGIL